MTPLSSFKLERRGLQICVALAACFTVWGGLRGALFGMAGISDPAFGMRGAVDVVDSHFTYLSGIMLAIGIWFWASVPHIEKHSRRFDVLVSAVFAGGVFRLIRVVEGGITDRDTLISLALEVVVAPLLLLWQRRIAHQYKTLAAAARKAREENATATA
ncbi:MAG: DUF4345 domain-containing protein [Rhodospirillales bacterium]|nr:DUF4345 domain-containing protein [Alphaproteobacteria bacterium]MCB9987425.1 DUF4345 domain-containing protein [Rhodospirillales bacterium]USO07593.1 MAG: DUF4345 domain-containing protein [Rhodospirillales bacterium]